MENSRVFSKTPGVWGENIGKSPKATRFVEGDRFFEGGELMVEG
jgi:hypothetical protein